MKQSLACVCVLSLSVACSANSGPTGSQSTGGSTGTAGAHSNGGGGGTASGGTSASAGTGGTSVGGSNSGGGGASSTAGAAGTGGAAATAGTGGASSGSVFKCPADPGTFALPSGSATRIDGAPPQDDFNKNAGFTNVEGPVWIGESLYFSEMLGGSDKPAARILKLTPGSAAVVAVSDSGSNGLAVDASGNLWAAVHKDGSISQVTLPGGPVTPVVTGYADMVGQSPTRFISPNDLTIRDDGTIYFSDPYYQNQSGTPPQSAQRAYRVSPAPARTVTPIDGAPSTPNGITLSPDQKTLYINGQGGFKKFAVMSDGSLGPVADFAMKFNGDGMAVDCLGNVYVAGGGSSVAVFSSSGASLGPINISNMSSTTTNVAFGGSDHKTLYITAQGNVGQNGVFSIQMPVAGLPY